MTTIRNTSQLVLWTMTGLLLFSPVMAQKKKKKKATESAAVETPLPTPPQTIVTEPTPPSIEYSHIELPKQVMFCGKEIDLTRFDRRERIDREILSMTFMHSTSLLMLKRANRYFPVVAPILKQHDIPEDFLYLMVIESNLNPKARSAVGAAGLWQFMPGTAKDFGLEVNTEVDERLDVRKSTDAACRYLKQAYQRFGNWESVAASYNAGQARISQFMSNQNENSALDLHMTEETTRYIYRIIATKILFTNPKAFGFKLRRTDFYAPIESTAVEVNGEVSDWAAFAQRQGITYAMLRLLNPWIISSSLTNKQGKTYQVAIPTDAWMHYDPTKMPIYSSAWVAE